MKGIDSIIEELRSHKAILMKNFAVKQIGIFGSFARGAEKEKSDIDVYIEFYLNELDFSKYLELIEFLEKLFNRKVDIVTKEGSEAIRVSHVKKDIKKSIVYA